MATKQRTVTVFGGTGFLGRRAVRHLLDHSFAVRAAARHPHRGREIFHDKPAGLELVRADVSDAPSVAAAVAGAFAVVNAVSLYVEQGDRTFRSVHVDAAARVAAQARSAGVQRLVHVSGIGADAASASDYIRSRGQGEAAVRREFPAAIVMRPSVMVGPDDAFLTPLVRLLRALPVFPLFGRGETALQPACVDDVAEAIARALEAPQPEPVYDLGGPRTYRYEALVRMIAQHVGARTALVPLPFGVWRGLAFAAEMLPNPPVTTNQIDLMEIDNVASGREPGFDALGIVPSGIESVLERMRERDT
jgi:NADH dehydrogenase